MSLFGKKGDGAIPAAPVAPVHPALASPQALAGASLRDLGAAVLLAGVAPGPGPNLNRLTVADVQDRVNAMVRAAAPGPETEQAFEGSEPYQVVNEGVQVLEQSLLVRTRPEGSELVITVNRRGREAIGSGDAGAYMLVPDR